MVYAFLSAVALAIFLIRTAREPRRLGNAVWLGVALVFGGLWLLFSGRGLLADATSVLLLVLVALVVLVLPAALIANGVVMWRREGRRPANLLSLLAGVALVALFGLCFYAVAYAKSTWVIVLAVSLTLVAGYLAFLFASLLVYSVLYGRMSRRSRADAIVVLGSGLLGDRVPPLLASRLDGAARRYRREVEAGADPVIVVSGGQGPDELVSEAAAMSAYLRRAGIPERAILLEDRATTTDQNLRYSVALLQRHGRLGRVLVVTNNYHVFRTAVLSRRLKLRLGVIGVPTAAYFVPSAFLREFVALVAQYRRTNLAIGFVLAAGPVLLALITAGQ
ncbi:YdcF family protein [Amycolatopsis anabasis]|uniref:YdcF family protein n=1 Tax=Amycolatopsis anabasis TaxID=1840409 RepID=UPI00131DECCB|nr:YdcF family protein [Amycolatopsis anabasis]